RYSTYRLGICFPGSGVARSIALKILGKINLLVCVMGAVALLIGATAFSAMHEYSRNLTAYEQAAARSYAGERLNLFVTACP
ncbi:hypothetical protein ACC715_36855, partial [Rhizobium ruizarguesonis]